MSISVKDSNGNFYKTASTPIVDSSLSSSSKNAIMNRAVYAALQSKVEAATVNLVNYYLKSETYTKEEVDALVGEISTLSIKVVADLPTTEISTTTLYFVGPATGTTNYTQYIYSDGTWVSLGTTAVDLSDYVTDSELTLAIADFVTEAGVAAMVSDFYTKSEVDALIGNMNLAELKDTSINSPANGQYLRYDTSLKKWTNGSTVISTESLGDIGDVTIEDVEDGQIIAWNAENARWENASIPSAIDELNDISDVDIANPADGDVLTYDATNDVWVNATGAVTIDELGDISDVDLTNLQDGQTIVWDATNSKWINGTIKSTPLFVDSNNYISIDYDLI